MDAQGSFYAFPPSALDVISAHCRWDMHIVTPHIRNQQVPLSAANVVLFGRLCRAAWRSVPLGTRSMGDGFHLIVSTNYQIRKRLLVIFLIRSCTLTLIT